ncbi:putative metal ion transporter YfjQ [Paraliobacillus quinghaiensis]|uniref:Magnesium transport protein CorA n=1 Tax=Paraliobacillus quinghaiensis TaxID=470815 RepID=A0A917TPN0_9BACI|nr:magnesium/cobalt transporter CorA [Paraliobacillus quinghaiensis]GGM32151.1 putative metal ion transporter YfjQ [Paraliobacillus quinghaiensis]
MIDILAVDKYNNLIKLDSIEGLQQGDYAWYWIDFNQPTDTEVIHLSESLHFHPLAIEDCLQQLQRAKLDYYDAFSFFIMYAIDPKDLSQQEHDFFLHEDYIVTFHKQPSRQVSQVWERLIKMQAKDIDNWGPYRIFYEISDKIVDHYFPLIYELEDQLNEVEDNPNEEAMSVLLDRLFDIRHQLLQLRHTINPMRDLFYRMLNSSHLTGLKERRAYFTDVYDHLLKLSEMVASNREIANDIRDNYLSLNSHQTNEVMKVLTIITSIFAPLTFIAGIYGMNFVNMPELEWEYGYFVVLGVMGVMAVVMYLWFKRKGWF